jgi:hypothetical protein
MLTTVCLPLFEQFPRISKYMKRKALPTLYISLLTSSLNLYTLYAAASEFYVKISSLLPEKKKVFSFTSAKKRFPKATKEKNEWLPESR